MLLSFAAHGAAGAVLHQPLPHLSPRPTSILAFRIRSARCPSSISRRLVQSRRKLRPRNSSRCVQARPQRRPRRNKPANRCGDSADAPEQTARGGSPFGHVPGSPLTGDEVVPAFPDVYPDPPVSRGDLPSGVQGDVIVEVTIDPQGNVVETKLLQGIGYGIEQKVLEGPAALALPPRHARRRDHRLAAHRALPLPS